MHVSMVRISVGLATLTVLALAGCGDDADGTAWSFSVGEDGTASDEVGDSGEAGESQDEGSSDGGESDDGSSEGGIKLDVLGEDTTTGPDPMGDPCQLVDDLDGYGTKETAPPDSFMPVLEWAWEGEGDFNNIRSNPVVGNLTDDDRDGDIDLCDTPDLVAVVYRSGSTESRLYVFDGETGAVHFMVESTPQTPIGPSDDLAIGDIDGDGVMEIVVGAKLVLEHDGTPKWAGGWGRAPALADLDNDGDVEILSGERVYDHLGNEVWALPNGGSLLTTSADLDGDDDQEVILFGEARHHDGSVYFQSDEPEFNTVYGAQSVADIDDDGLPEIIYTSEYGITILEHDGTTKVSGLRPTGEAVGHNNWNRPTNIHDYDGDLSAEIGVKTNLSYVVAELSGDVIYATPVNEWNNLGSGGTAFDFLGDGTAEGIYADNHTLWVFNEVGDAIFDVPRTSGTWVEYPIVVDIDNDSSSEIVVTSMPGEGNDDPSESPTIQVYRDAEDRWVPSRRIWNQHTYHVTNVREDGTIPQVEIPHWTTNNTFRTQSQITVGTTLKPEG